MRTRTRGSQNGKDGDIVRTSSPVDRALKSVSPSPVSPPCLASPLLALPGGQRSSRNPEPGDSRTSEPLPIPTLQSDQRPFFSGELKFPQHLSKEQGTPRHPLNGGILTPFPGQNLLATFPPAHSITLSQRAPEVHLGGFAKN